MMNGPHATIGWNVPTMVPLTMTARPTHVHPHSAHVQAPNTTVLVHQGQPLIPREFNSHEAFAHQIDGTTVIAATNVTTAARTEANVLPNSNRNKMQTTQEQQSQQTPQQQPSTNNKQIQTSPSKDGVRSRRGRKRKSSVSPPRNFVCDVCFKGFTQKGNLQTHYKIHSGEASFECEDCGKRFVQKGNLKTHTRIHTKEKPYACTICGDDKRFTQLNHLQRHLSIAHNSYGNDWKCEICPDATFAWKHDLSMHRKIFHNCDKDSEEMEKLTKKKNRKKRVNKSARDISTSNSHPTSTTSLSFVP